MICRYPARLMRSAVGRPTASYFRLEANRTYVGFLDRRIAFLHYELWHTPAVGIYSGIAFLDPVRIRFQRGRGLLPHFALGTVRLS
jgi:hypothetical protein